MLLTPIAGAGAARRQEFDAVRRQLQQKMQVVIPPDQVQSRVDEARTQIDAFYKDRLAGGASALSAELGKLAASSGVRLNSAHYPELESDLPGLTHVRIDANITGDYVAAVKFINGVERDKMFFIVDSVNLAEQQAGIGPPCRQPGNLYERWRNEAGHRKSDDDHRGRCPHGHRRLPAGPHVGGRRPARGGRQYHRRAARLPHRPRPFAVAAVRVGRRGADRSAPVVNTLDPRLRLDLLKLSEDTEYKGAGRNIFSRRSRNSQAD